MRKGLHIYLVRHGETEGNIDRSLYRDVADHAVRLTPRGIEQASEAGEFLASRLFDAREEEGENFGLIRLWHSPYYRARQTAQGILYALGQKFDPESGVLTYREEPFLMEQKAGLFDGMTEEEFERAYPQEAANYNKHKGFFGRMYGSTPLGESRMDVVIRVKQLFRTIVEDYTGRNIRHVVVVSHGVTMRAFLMGWMRYSPEWMDAEKNPGNCWVRHVYGSREEGGYRDDGYVFGEEAPLGNPLATQRPTEGARQVVMLKPQRPNAIVPPGVVVIDPFKKGQQP